MSKEVITKQEEVTYFEIIKLGPEIDNFDDRKRITALHGCFGYHVKFFDGPEMADENFVEQLVDKIRSFKDLVAIEVSPELDDIAVRLIIEKSLGTMIIQPQFSNSVFIRYVSFGLGELTVRPVDLSAGHL